MAESLYKQRKKKIKILICETLGINLGKNIFNAVIDQLSERVKTLFFVSMKR